ncbi:hypothetical protein KKF38_04430 [Patescibacteria group bacterium]|nr:hypothetical protein [Patescibacteria group bacterium]
MAKFKKKWRFVRATVTAILSTIGASLFFLNFQETEVLPLEKISANFVAERMQLMRNWFLTNARDGDTLPYFYDPADSSFQKDNNIIRQLLTTQGIFALARELEDAELREVGEQNLAAVFRKYFKTEETPQSSDGMLTFGFFEGNGKVKLGGAALGIIAILEGELTEKYSEELAALANFLEAMQQPNGSFQTFYRPADFETNERFYSGEALLAAARLFEFSGEAKWLDFVERGFEYYRPKITENFSPQFVPWHTMAYAEIFERTGEQKYADFIFWLNDELIAEMLEKNPIEPATLGRFYNSEKHAEYGPPHSSSTAVYVEGLTYAFETAEKIDDGERVKNYREAVRLGTRSLLQLQFTFENSREFENPERLVGAIRRAVDRNEIRIDQIGHTANALPRMKKILEK